MFVYFKEFNLKMLAGTWYFIQKIYREKAELR